MRAVTPSEWQQLMKKPAGAVVLDVRLPLERRMGHVPESRNIPLKRMREALTELETGPTYAVADDGGRRSYVAVQLLLQAGLDAEVPKVAPQLYSQALRSGPRLKIHSYHLSLYLAAAEPELGMSTLLSYA